MDVQLIVSPNVMCHGSISFLFVIGWVYDLTKQYEEAFLLGGGLTVLSALILIVIPVLSKRESQRMYEDYEAPPKYEMVIKINGTSSALSINE